MAHCHRYAALAFRDRVQGENLYIILRRITCPQADPDRSPALLGQAYPDDGGGGGCSATDVRC